MVDLTALILPSTGLTLVDASYINDLGEIAGQAFDPKGNLHACLLVPATPAEIADAAATAQAPASVSTAMLSRAEKVTRLLSTPTNRHRQF